MEQARKMVVVPCGCSEQLPVICPADQVDQTIACPWSGQRMEVSGETPFGAAEWDRRRDPRILECALFALGIESSQRKRRLMACASARLIETPEAGSWTLRAIETGESLADETEPTIPPELIRRHLPAGLAQACIAISGTLPRVEEQHERLVALVYQDLFPNPFVPLTWNPEWLTSTVRDLAAHIYESRDFSAMPILGDALMDAGCEHQLIQDHCRTTKPHARGCWVVDAILGKT